VECKNTSDTCNTEATGTVSKSFVKYLINIPGKHNVKEVQKAVALSTEHILQKVLILCASYIATTK
jgi:hypothetical protein